MADRPTPDKNLSREEILEASPDAIIAISQADEILSWNRGAEAIFGFAREEALGRSIYDLIVPEDRKEETLSAIRAALEGRQVAYESVRRRKDGSLVTVDVTKGVIRNTHGKPQYIISAKKDVTALKVQREARVIGARFRDLLESVPDATVIANREGRIVLVNAQTEKLFGHPREALLGQPVEVLVPERFRGTHVRYRTGYFDDPRARSMGAGLELYGLRKDGTEFPVEISLSPLRTEEGVMAMSAIRDITDRKKVEVKFQGLLESAPDAIVIVNREGRIVLINAQAERLLGYRREALIDQPIEALIPERFREAHVGHRAKYFEDPKMRAMGAGLELYGRRSDGGEFPVEINLSPLETEEGTWTISAIRDITDRKRSEEKLRRKDVFLDSIIENIPDMIFVKEAKDLRFVRFNKAGEILLGYAREELIGKNDYDFFPKEQADFFTSKDRQVLEAGYLVDIPQEPIQTRHGMRILHTKKIPLYDAEGTPLYLLGISEDITERRQTEDEMHKINVQLEAANKELEAFSYSVSHDLRAPLRHIIGFIELLKRHAGAQLDAKGQRYADTILNAAKRMGNLIDDLLVFSRMAKSEMRIGKVNLDRIIRGVIRDLQAETVGREIAWRIGHLPDVVGDKSMLRQVWVNLIGNAVKYTRPRKRAEIEIGSRVEGGEQVLFIRDNGVGFDPQYAENLFGVFQRLHRSDEFEGTGIGLANVRRIVHRHGGRTWAEGEIDRGASFYFSLPNRGEKPG